MASKTLRKKRVDRQEWHRGRRQTKKKESRTNAQQKKGGGGIMSITNGADCRD